MERPYRLALLPAMLAVGACTMIGAPELTRPPPLDADRIPELVPRTEPPSRAGNMAQYEQSGRTYRVLESSYGYDERGIASWYGEGFHGRPTSSGEAYDMHQLSAAHRTLPLPTYVEVTNLSNGRRVIVRVNDRGPFHEPDARIIDLSYAAAVKLGMGRSGTAPVRVRAIEPWQYRTRDDADGS
jgi:rare lipoprotein A